MRSPSSRLLTAVSALWPARLMWVATAVAAMWSIGGAVDARSSALRWTVAAGGWGVWGLGIVTLVVPSALGLTLVRMLSALTCAVSAVSWVGGAPSGAGIVFVLGALLFATVVFSAAFGQQCVQASAYGDEHRFLLRPPAAFLVPVVVSGVIWSAALITAPLLLASRQWVAGAVLAALAILATWLVVPRFHVLTRRWLVLVPAGIVVHDHVVLAETLMVSRRDVAAVQLALAGTEAADLTGPAAGHAIEVALKAMTTATLAPTRAAPRGRALHLQSFLVAPTRPGAFLSALK
jgi:hypothetical protein